MTIDIRANVFCSLGPIIEGALSDSYVQDNGLIYCRGSVRLDGLYQPTLGQVVDFGYQKGGWLARFPRRLRVLSSFADPFTRQTQIELGCKLTYLKDYKVRDSEPATGRAIPAIAMKASNDNTNPVRPQERGYVPQSIAINAIINLCLNKLGITASAQLPFTSRFNGSKFEADTPYVQMLDEILKSAAYIGYLDESEQLVLRNLTTDSGTGPVISRDDIIAMEPIAVGELGGETVDVEAPNYSYAPGAIQASGETIDAGSPQKDPGDPEPPDLDPPEDPPEDDEELPPARVLWTYDESIGSPVEVRTTYNPAPPAPTVATDVFSYVPFVYTQTEYDDNNRVSRRITKERTYAPVVNGSWWKEALEFYNGAITSTYPLTIESVERYEYDNDGTLLRQVQERYEPEIATVGKSSAIYLFDGSGGRSLFTPSLTLTYLSERITTEYSRWETRIEAFYESSESDTIVKFSKTKRTVEKLQLHTQEGQQAVAKQAENTTDVSGMVALVDAMLQYIVIDSCEVQNSQEVSTAGAEQIAPPEQARPDPDLLIAKKFQKEKPIEAKVNINAGQETDKRQVSYRLPRTFSDYYVYDAIEGKYKPAGESINAQVLRFARIQNRLRLANRAGLSLQLEPNLVPVRPFDPLYINLDGLVGQYRVNGTSWAFTADGIAAQVDAMFWGGVGTA
jgi:hypothetical protein